MLELFCAFIGVVGAVGGAVWGGRIAGNISRQATQDLLDGERAKRNAEQKEQAVALLSTLHAEIASVWWAYAAMSGKLIDQLHDGAFKYYVPIIGDYFPVYHGNVQFLGLLEEHLRAQIISGYNLAKSLVDTLRLNNEFLKERDRALEMVWTQTGNTQAVLKLKEQQLTAYGPLVKEAHNRAKEAAETLIPLLAAQIRKG
jgi:hypothetical protein